ncbi:hypothetical protein Q31a_50620 [Aureliella helgolandensis]|uniref:Uncharacterized protein n=1 Tax=Aureliella helgolandensis TaxID=2527968 RepID=A0A518GDJ9_9BACT|nr:hypothetical protein Q31a_50620 [Aureliella helgolandensis]
MASASTHAVSCICCWQGSFPAALRVPTIPREAGKPILPRNPSGNRQRRQYYRFYERFCGNKTTLPASWHVDCIER